MIAILTVTFYKPLGPIFEYNVDVLVLAGLEFVPFFDDFNDFHGFLTKSWLPLKKLVTAKSASIAWERGFWGYGNQVTNFFPIVALYTENIILFFL